MRIAVIGGSNQVSSQLIAALRDSVELVFGDSLSLAPQVHKYDLAIHLMVAWLDPGLDVIVTGMSWLYDLIACSLESKGPPCGRHNASCDQTRDKGSLSVWSGFQVQTGD